MSCKDISVLSLSRGDNGQKKILLIFPFHTRLFPLLQPWVVSRLRKALGSTLATAENQLGQTVGTNSISYVNEEDNAFPNNNET